MDQQGGWLARVAIDASKRRGGLTLCLLFCLVSPTFGEDLPQSTQAENLLEFIQEEQSLQPFELGEFLSSTSQPLGPTTSVFEVSAEDILDQNARSLADALRFVPGLFLSVGGTTAPSFASIRGLNARQMWCS